jgi:putative two-component system response regulator
METPVITLTASRDRETRLQIIELGVADFLSKPIDETELSTRLRNVIEAKRYREHLSQSAEQLERAVRQRTSQLEESRRDVVLCLARAAEYRDDNTGHHVIRVGRYSSILAAELGLPPVFVDMIEFAAQLHDVGKIGIPDSILHKPGRLTTEEMEVMRHHAEMGWKIIAPMAESKVVCEGTEGEDGSAGSQSPMLVMAARIALSHHEWFNGNGYPQRLSGTSIPLEARITAVADVFDALSTPRCYKPAIPLDRCFQTVEEESGSHFDPSVVRALLSARSLIEKQFHQLADHDTEA